MRRGFFIKPNEKAGMVVKKFPYPIKREHFEDFKRLHENYVRLLSKAEIKVPETTVDFIKKGKGLIPVITQPAFRDDELVDSIFYNGSKRTILNVYRKMLKENFKIINYNKKNEVKIGFDGTPRNLAIRGNKIYYFDTFPFFIKGNKIAHKLIKTQVRRGLRTLSVIGYKKVMEQFFKPDKMIRSVFASSVKRRPELREDFKKITKEVVGRYVKSEEVKPFLNFRRSLISRAVSVIRSS